jgi:hypothetical protein
MPSRAILVGDHVRIPWGLDTLDGVVEDIYEHGSSRRVVVRVAVPGAGDDGETVTLPAEVVRSQDEAENASPGEWVTEVRYERKVGEALVQLLAALSPEGRVVANVEMDRNREADL